MQLRFVLDFVNKYAHALKTLVRKYPRLELVPLWSAALATGIVSVLFAESFVAAEKFSLTIYKTNYVYILAPCCFLLSWFLVHRFAPDAKGSGIPQVMAAIKILNSSEDKRLNSLLGFQTIAVKFVSALVLVAGGGAAGREGPTIQIAAGVFYLFHRPFKRLFPALNAESWIIAGGGAGIAAAFNTPLGGLVYAIEELATKHFVYFRTTLISAVMMAGLMALWMQGNYLYFGSPAVGSLTAIDHFHAMLLGIVGGVTGGVFGILLGKISRWRKKNLKTFLSMSLAAIGASFVLIALLHLTREGSIGPGRELVLSYLSGKTSVDWDLVAGRFLSPLITYFAGGAGGIFAPSLATGASFGAIVAKLTGSAHLEFLVMMGMIGFLTGVTHAPFTSMVLVLEMTDRHSTIFPMMLTTFCAYGATRLISSHSFYELVKEDFIGATAVDQPTSDPTAVSKKDSQ